MPIRKQAKDKKPKKKILKNKVIKQKSSNTQLKKSESAKEDFEEKTDGVQSVASAKGKKILMPVRGMKDIVPSESSRWLDLYEKASSIAKAYNFEYIETPVLEEVSLFTRSIGKGTDIVSKEMYVFEDSDGTKLALRPELTASIARAYISNGMHSKPQPISVWYYCPMFRHDRPQAGRYRQFHQFGCETLGSNDPAIDAELIAIAYNYLLDLGVQSNVHINSIGTPSDRERYIVELVGYLRSKRSYLSEESKKRILKNPLRVLDSKEEEDKKVIEEAPQIIDWLSEESRQYFMKVLEYLDEMSIPYVLKPTLVRGLDYYTDTVFELVESEAAEESQNALGGGGRYNLLVEQLGGPSTPSAGFSIGLERALQASKRAKEKKAGQEQETKDTTPKLFFAHLGEQARRKTLVLIEQLRRENIFLKHSIGKPSLKAQLEMADKYGSTHTVILGQKELQDGTIIIRDMASGIQEIIDQKRLKKELGKILDIEKI